DIPAVGGAVDAPVAHARPAHLDASALAGRLAGGDGQVGADGPEAAAPVPARDRAADPSLRDACADPVSAVRRRDRGVERVAAPAHMEPVARVPSGLVARRPADRGVMPGKAEAVAPVPERAVPLAPVPDAAEGEAVASVVERLAVDHRVALADHPDAVRPLIRGEEAREQCELTGRRHEAHVEAPHTARTDDREAAGAAAENLDAEAAAAPREDVSAEAERRGSILGHVDEQPSARADPACDRIVTSEGPRGDEHVAAVAGDRPPVHVVPATPAGERGRDEAEAPEPTRETPHRAEGPRHNAS